MGAQFLSSAATVLHRTTNGDNWVRLQCFSVEHGRLDCLQRISQRASRVTPLLDLFDDIQLTLESRNAARTWFVREATVSNRRSGLGRSYDALRHACRFAAVVRDNPGPPESHRPIFLLLQRALQAWESGTRPDIVYVKSLYLLARDEGYPVAQEWRARLSPEARVLATSILGKPVEQQAAEVTTVEEMARNLEEYLRHHTEIRINV